MGKIRIRDTQRWSKGTVMAACVFIKHENWKRLALVRHSSIKTFPLVNCCVSVFGKIAEKSIPAKTAYQWPLFC
jgi:hypothetical protein